MLRSEDMSLCQLYLQPEAAYACISELGELGVVQFKDLNPDTNAYQKKFVNEIRRCDEMERQLRYFEKEVHREELEILDPASIPEAPAPRDMVDLEVTFEKLEGDLKELSSNTEALERNFMELLELKNVLMHTGNFLMFDGDEGVMSNARQALHRDYDIEEAMHASTAETNKKHIGLMAGVIQLEKMQPFMRVLWFACRGNVFVRHVDVEEPIVDPSTGDANRKAVFAVFFQGEVLQNKIKKICEGFRATLYPCPESSDERREMSIGVMARMQDINTVLQKSQEQRRRVLEQVTQNLSTWFIKVRKIKAIYHTMNMFLVEQKNYLAECWCPDLDLDRVQNALHKATEQSGTSAPSLLHKLHSDPSTLPTYFRQNKFTSGFQTIIDAYGVCRYKEINPALFATISFPFLFSCMFGDVGHGIIMFLFGLWMVVKEKPLAAGKSDNEIWNMFFGGRYMILLMGIFSIYAGFIYNDCFSKSLNVFGSSWRVPYENNTILPKMVTLDANDSRVYMGHPYPFGLDPVWQMTKNKITFTNSYKKKISVIFGVSQMLLGIIISLCNHIHFRRPLYIFGEFIPQILFLMSIFGYLVILIFVKWGVFNAATAGCAPNLLIGLINMFMFKYPTSDDPSADCSSFTWYPGQQSVQICLLVLAVVCVPWMLLTKPLFLRWINKRKEFRAKQCVQIQMPGESMTDADDVEMLPEGSLASSLNTASALAPDQEAGEEFDFGEIFMEQAIHTIEFCLGCISHTASYLRLWALSLAHAQLSDVAWKMVLRIGLSSHGWLGVILIPIVFVPWAAITVGVLLVMEGLSAFLHTLRLHWVEFQSKFYKGDGFPFEPFTFDDITGRAPTVD